jgi:hypothetical protein
VQERCAQRLWRMVGANGPGRLRGVAFRPYLLLNGLSFAATLSPDPARKGVPALAPELQAFAPLLAPSRPVPAAPLSCSDGSRSAAWGSPRRPPR